MGTALAIATRILMHVIYSREFSAVASSVTRQAAKEIIRHIQRQSQGSRSQRRYGWHSES